MIKKKQEITILMFDGPFFGQVRSRNIPISMHLLQKKAWRFANILGIKEFQASNGWLTTFKIQHNIEFKAICEEEEAIDKDVIKNWSANIEAITDGFGRENIFNADETSFVGPRYQKNIINFFTDSVWIQE